MPDYVSNGHLLLPRDQSDWTDGARDYLGTSTLLDEGPGYIPTNSRPLVERLSELELSIEDSGWLREAAWNDRDFSREGLKRVLRLARLSYLKNPLIHRAVEVQSYYVWGQGVEMRSADDAMNELIQDFLEDQGNQSELTSHQARSEKERELQVTGNLFFVFFTQPATGKVRVRTIPVDEVLSIITNPDDAREGWYYKREWVAERLDIATGIATPNVQYAYYPDWRYRPATKPPMIGQYPVFWDTPCYHVKVGALRDMRFGVPEIYAALDWARAVKQDLEDYATTKRALARFAWNMSTTGGAQGVANAKTRLGTTLGTGEPLSEANPPALTGSTFIHGEGTHLTPIRTAHQQPSPDEGRRLWLMVASATGLPECYASDTEVLTERGFILHQDWTPGTRVACFNPETRQCAWEHPASLSTHDYNGDMVHFKNAQTDILVTPNHRMWTARAVQWKLAGARGRIAALVGGPLVQRDATDDGSALTYRAWHIETAQAILDQPRDAGWKVTSAVRFAEPVAETDAEISYLKPEHVTTVPYAGFVSCFSVPTGIYVTRRNKQVAIQGNTFFGEASVGSHATAKTLDRPTELRMRDRQVLWADIFKDILRFVIEQAAAAPHNDVGASLSVDSDGNREVILDGADEKGKPRQARIDVMFPPMLERDALQRVGSIVQAVTLGGFPSAGTFDKRTIVQLLLEAIGVDDIGDKLDILAPEDGTPLLPPVLPLPPGSGPIAVTTPPNAPSHPRPNKVLPSGSVDDTGNSSDPVSEAKREPLGKAWMAQQAAQTEARLREWDATHQATLIAAATRTRATNEALRGAVDKLTEAADALRTTGQRPAAYRVTKLITHNAEHEIDKIVEDHTPLRDEPAAEPGE